MCVLTAAEEPVLELRAKTALILCPLPGVAYKEDTEPSRGEGLDGSATAEERDNYHRDAYENARNHASGPPAARG